MHGRNPTQVLLEANRVSFAGEFHDDDKRPGSGGEGMPARAVVMPFESVAHVVGDPDVLPRRIGFASQDVDDSLFDSVHLQGKRTDRTIMKLEQTAKCALAVRSACDLYSTSGGRIETESPPSQLRLRAA